MANARGATFGTRVAGDVVEMVHALRWCCEQGAVKAHGAEVLLCRLGLARIIVTVLQRHWNS